MQATSEPCRRGVEDLRCPDLPGREVGERKVGRAVVLRSERRDHRDASEASADAASDVGLDEDRVDDVGVQAMAQRADSLAPAGTAGPR